MKIMGLRRAGRRAEMDLKLVVAFLKYKILKFWSFLNQISGFGDFREFYELS